MTAYKKLAGAWNPAQRIYVRSQGTWMPSDVVYVKRNGTWQIAHNYDVTPPDAPQISLELVDTEYWDSGVRLLGRYINVSVRQAATTHDTTLARIRVLSSYNGRPPSTQFGGTYTELPQDGWLEEPWSDFHYNAYSGVSQSHHTNVLATKTWPRNASVASNLGAGTYYFGAWAQDNAGNWSAGTFAEIVLPRRGIETTNFTVKEQRFAPTVTGTWSDGTFTYGRPTQSGNPRRRGVFFYGNSIATDIGAQGTPKIRKAQVRLERRDDTGLGQANVWLARHTFATPAAFGEDPAWNDGVYLGTIGKGEAKWFDLPSTWYSELENTGLRGFILLHKDPAKANAAPEDYSMMNAYTDSIRCGELHVIWSEDL